VSFDVISIIQQLRPSLTESRHILLQSAREVDCMVKFWLVAFVDGISLVDVVMFSNL